MARWFRTIRSLIGVAVLVGLAAFGTWWHRRATEKERIIAEQQRVIAQLEQALDRAWAEEIVADVRVDGVTVDPKTGKSEIDLTFVHYEPGTEKPRLQRRMKLPGQEFYVDALVVRFERKFVDAGDGLRGKSLLFFRRAFGDQQKPADGVPLYRSGGNLEIPEFVQVDERPSDFEREIWSKFWEYANDPDRAKEAGVRVAQGEAPHIRPVPGQVYKLTLRSSGGLEITPRLPAGLVGVKPDATP